jgi:hypothetical protein
VATFSPELITAQQHTDTKQEHDRGMELHLKKIKTIRNNIKRESGISIKRESNIKKDYCGLIIILILLVIIGVVTYFGFLFFEERDNKRTCEMPAGLECSDAEGDNTAGIKFTLQNKAGFDMNDVRIYLNSTQEKGNVLCKMDLDEPILREQERKTVFCQNLNIKPGLLKGVVSITYTNANTKQENYKTGRIEITIPTD